MLSVLLQARTHQRCGHESRGPRSKMDDVAARKVCHAHASEPAAAPQAKGTYGIEERHPYWAEDHPCREVHAAKDRAAKNDDGDGSEYELKENERGHWEGERRHAPGSSWNRRLPSREQCRRRQGRLT